MLLAHGTHGTPRSELAFLTYAELGYGRSLARLAEKLGKSVGKTRVRLPTLESWSAKYHWQERVKLYDQERAEERRREQEAAIDTMNGEHASMAYNAAQLAAQQIRELMEEKRFSAHAAVQLLKVSTDLERLARGVATESIKLDVPQGLQMRNVLSIDITQLTNDELLMLEGIVQRIEASEEEGAA